MASGLGAGRREWGREEGARPAVTCCGGGGWWGCTTQYVDVYAVIQILSYKHHTCTNPVHVLTTTHNPHSLLSFTLSTLLLLLLLLLLLRIVQ